jgi:hypothetical protein
MATHAALLPTRVLRGFVMKKGGQLGSEQLLELGAFQISCCIAFFLIECKY